MNIYLVTQKENNDWDTYDGIVVAAQDENEAATIKPLSTDSYGDWAFTQTEITVKLIGKADKSIEKGIILGSFNAG